MASLGKTIRTDVIISQDADLASIIMLARAFTADVAIDIEVILLEAVLQPSQLFRGAFGRLCLPWRLS
jgi:hypothetical protein